MTVVGDIVQTLAQQDDVNKLLKGVSKLTITITLLIVYVAVELGSKPDSVLKGLLDLVKGMSKGGKG